MNLDEQLIEDTKGFLDKEEGMRLYELTKEVSKSAPCLEIGSYCGKSTIYLGCACKENDSTLFAVDHHRGSEEQQKGEEYFDPTLYDNSIERVDTFKVFRKTLELSDLENTVVPLVTKSEIAAKFWSTPLGAVFIDGGHSFEAAFNDYTCWARHIIPGGYLFIHDIFKDPSEGGQAPYDVYKIAIASRQFRVLEMTKTLGVLQRLDCGETPEDLKS